MTQTISILSASAVVDGQPSPTPNSDRLTRLRLYGQGRAGITFELLDGVVTEIRRLRRRITELYDTNEELEDQVQELEAEVKKLKKELKKVKRQNRCREDERPFEQRLGLVLQNVQPSETLFDDSETEIEHK